MKVGDLVKRKIPLEAHFRDEEENGVLGFVVALMYGGNPTRPTASILYPPSGNRYEIARSLLKVVNQVEV